MSKSHGMARYKFMFNLHNRFANKHDFDDLKDDVKRLAHDVTEIKAGIHLAKWAFVTAIALIPVVTTVFGELTDGVLHPDGQHPHRLQQQIIIKNPDGTFTIPSLSK